MKILLEIPKEFESDYKGDTFKDFFSRVLCDIENGTLCGNYEKETAEMFLKAFDKSKPVNESVKGDLISRAGVSNLIRGYFINLVDSHYYKMDLVDVNADLQKEIADLPIACNDGWIPCSERLPEDMQKCLTIARIYVVPDHVDEPDNYIGIELNIYSERFGWLGGNEVIEWQPLPSLPQPYKENENG